MKRKEIKFRCDEKTEAVLAETAEEMNCSKYALVNRIVNEYLLRTTGKERKKAVELMEKAEENISACLQIFYTLEFMTDDEKRRFGADCISEKLSKIEDILEKIREQFGEENRDD